MVGCDERCNGYAKSFGAMLAGATSIFDRFKCAVQEGVNAVVDRA